MKLGQIDKHINCYIFRELCKRCKSFRLRKKDVHISYTTVKENGLDTLSKIGLNRKKFGLYSLRAGGATAATNIGVSDRLSVSKAWTVEIRKNKKWIRSRKHTGSSARN